MHRRVAGSAASRALAIGLPHSSQSPYRSSRSRASASSTSVKCACACARNATSCSRSNAMVEPSGSCSSSRLLPTAAAATAARSAVMEVMRRKVAVRSAVSRASASWLFTSPVCAIGRPRRADPASPRPSRPNLRRSGGSSTPQAAAARPDAVARCGAVRDARCETTALLRAGQQLTPRTVRAIRCRTLPPMGADRCACSG